MVHCPGSRWCHICTANILAPFKHILASLFVLWAMAQEFSTVKKPVEESNAWEPATRGGHLKSKQKWRLPSFDFMMLLTKSACWWWLLSCACSRSPQQELYLHSPWPAKVLQSLSFCMQRACAHCAFHLDLQQDSTIPVLCLNMTQWNSALECVQRRVLIQTREEEIETGC